MRHIIDAQLREAAERLGQKLTHGGVCPDCLRELLPTAGERAPYLERSA